MKTFKGFNEKKTHQIPVPEIFFSQLLTDIDNLAELKLTLHLFWQLDNLEGKFRFFRHSELAADERLLSSLGEESLAGIPALDEALQLAIERGTLLKADLEIENQPDTLYFLNSPRGRAAVRAIQNGQWQLSHLADIGSQEERPNIFQLYEENIGPLTPLIAETLGEAQDSFPPDWIEDAVQIAVKNNKRTWRYVSAILERWQREGRHDKKEKPEDRRDTPEARRRYIEGEFSDFIEH
jgi:DNA replication protein